MDLRNAATALGLGCAAVGYVLASGQADEFELYLLTTSGSEPAVYADGCSMQGVLEEARPVLARFSHSMAATARVMEGGEAP